jgi:hypothetical protein
MLSKSKKNIKKSKHTKNTKKNKRNQKGGVTDALSCKDYESKFAQIYNIIINNENPENKIEEIHRIITGLGAVFNTSKYSNKGVVQSGTFEKPEYIPNPNLTMLAEENENEET